MSRASGVKKPLSRELGSMIQRCQEKSFKRDVKKRKVPKKRGDQKAKSQGKRDIKIKTCQERGLSRESRERCVKRNQKKGCQEKAETGVPTERGVRRKGV